MPAIDDGQAVVGRAALLAEAADLLDVPVAATEQYPQGSAPRCRSWRRSRSS
ncbi:hypothetical protein ACFQV8_12275 [Pseudonocardia benzenivorans]